MSSTIFAFLRSTRLFHKPYWVKNTAEEKPWNCYQWKSNVTDFIIFAWASLQGSRLHHVSCGPPKGRELRQGCARTQRNPKHRSSPRCGQAGARSVSFAAPLFSPQADSNTAPGFELENIMSQTPVSSVSYFSIVIGFKSPIQNRNLWPILGTNMGDKVTFSELFSRNGCRCLFFLKKLLLIKVKA